MDQNAKSSDDKNPNAGIRLFLIMIVVVIVLLILLKKFVF